MKQFFDQLRFVVLFSLFFNSAYGVDVPRAYTEVARDYDIPEKILYAVAVVESRRSVHGLRRPWPWTLNVSGKAFYFNTKQAAVNKLEGEVSNGNMNVAIGLMQIYWKYHFDQFNRPGDLLEPITNLRYGAQYLKKMFRNEGDWYLAVGQYHSGNKTPKGLERANTYAENVVSEWEKL